MSCDTKTQNLTTGYYCSDCDAGVSPFRVSPEVAESGLCRACYQKGRKEVKAEAARVAAERGNPPKRTKRPTTAPKKETPNKAVTVRTPNTATKG